MNIHHLEHERLTCPMIECGSRCLAINESGEQCGTRTIADSDFCAIHIGGSTSRRAPSSKRAVSDANGSAHSASLFAVSALSPALEPELELLRHELESLKRELAAHFRNIDRNDLNPAQMMHIVNRFVGGRLPSTQAAFLVDVERNLEDASFADFVDPDVLRGFAMLTYYGAQAQAEMLRAPLSVKLRSAPGFNSLRRLRNNLAGATLQDALDLDTWKGLWYLTNYSAQLKTLEIFGVDEDDDC